jgi:hypothetical protein
MQFVKSYMAIVASAKSRLNQSEVGISNVLGILRIEADHGPSGVRANWTP